MTKKGRRLTLESLVGHGDKVLSVTPPVAWVRPVVSTVLLPAEAPASQPSPCLPAPVPIPQLAGSVPCSASTSHLAASMTYGPDRCALSFTSDRPHETGSGVDIIVKNDSFTRVLQISIRSYADSALTLVPRSLPYGSWLTPGLGSVANVFHVPISLSGVAFLIDVTVTLVGGSAIFSGTISPE